MKNSLFIVPTKLLFYQYMVFNFTNTHAVHAFILKRGPGPIQKEFNNLCVRNGHWKIQQEEQNVQRKQTKHVLFTVYSNVQQQELPSSPCHPPPIWFIILDSATGESYKGTSADKVIFDAAADVVDFRKQIHRENASILTGITPSQLLVYKNKESFDKRYVPNDPEGKPLEEDSFINGLGKSKKEALVVVVPSSISLVGPFPLCGVPFYKTISSATERDGFISFEQNMPSTSFSKLYIRESYRTIASSIQPGINKVIITGTPGIGKSLFLIYLLWKLVKEGKRVLFIYHPFNIYYDGQGGVFVLDTIPTSIHQSFWNESLWCLFDAKYKKEDDLNKFPVELCTFVLSTSPRREMVNDFKKPPVPQIFYMPIWTKMELEAISPLFPHVGTAQLYERFEILGGIPRTVLENTAGTARNPTQMLEAASSECSLDDCIKKIGMDSTITEKSKVIHSLIHMTSAPPYTESSVWYASQTALNAIVKIKAYDARNKMRELLASCEGNPLCPTLCGYIFEPYALELLERGGTFTCRQLARGNAKVSPQDTELYIPSSKKIVVDKVVPNQSPKQLYVPKTKTYAAIDAWIPGIGAFQITVGKRHEIKGGARDDLAMLGHGANKLYWLVPPLYYNTFTKKSPKDIDQYAVLIKYPE